MNQQPSPPTQSSGKKLALIAAGLFLLLGAIFMVSYNGLPVMVDEWYYADWTQAFVQHPANRIQPILDSGSLAQSLYKFHRLPFLIAMAIPYKLAQAIKGIGVVHGMGVTNVFATALAGMFVFLSGIALGYRTKTALFVSLVFGLATPAWFYSKTYVREPFAGMWLIGGFFFLVLFRKRHAFWAMIVAVLFFLVAMLTRSSLAVFLPFVAIYVLVVIATIFRESFVSAKSARKKYLLGIIASLLVLFFIIAGYFFFKLTFRQYGTYLGSLTSLLDLSGKYGFAFLLLTVSPSRGIFIYFPAILLAIIGAYSFIKRHPLDALILYTPFIIYLLGTAHYDRYWSGWGWMSRYLIPFTSYFALATIALVDHWLFGNASRWKQVVAWGLFGLSFAVQVLGAFAHGPASLSKIYRENLAGAFDWHFFPFVWQAIRFKQLDPSVGWYYLYDGWMKAVIVVGFLLIAGIATLTIFRVSQERWRVSRGGAILLGAAIFFVVMMFVSMRIYFFNDARYDYRAGYYDTALMVRENADRAQDAFVEDFWVEDVYGFYQIHSRLMEFCNGDCPRTRAMAREDWNKKDEKQRVKWYRGLVKPGGRLWLIPTELPPASPNSIVEMWLTENTFLEQCQWTAETVRLCTYARPPKAVREEEKLTETHFGDAILLKQGLVLIDPAQQTVRAGTPLYLELHWQALTPPGVRYKISLQLLDGGGVLKAQHDREPLDGYRPTDSWQPGEEIIDRYAFRLPADLPPGPYRLLLILYDSNTGERLKINGTEADFAELLTVEVK